MSTKTLRDALRPFLRCVTPNGEGVYPSQVEALTNGDLVRLAAAWRASQDETATAESSERALRGALRRLATASDESDGEFGGDRLDELRDARESAAALVDPVNAEKKEG